MCGWQLRWTSERSIWAASPDDMLHSRVMSELVAWITSQHIASIRATTPSSGGVLIEFDTRLCIAEDPWSMVVGMLESFARERPLSGSTTALAPREVRIPVCYDGSFAPDMNEVAQRLGYHPDKIVEMHTAAHYTVDTIGFMPGFGYLSPLHDSLRLPRKTIPRTHVPAGSVAIAENMTAVYPNQSAGGWHLIGRTPLRLFEPENKDPALLRIGDSVRFEPITLEEFNDHDVTQQWGDR
ncbi:MAG: 5-oxoprolinase subunit PxpB [Phycisphaerales bacterium]